MRITIDLPDNTAYSLNENIRLALMSVADRITTTYYCKKELSYFKPKSRVAKEQGGAKQGKIYWENEKGNITFNVE